MQDHADEKLSEYRRKRDFARTLEPAGGKSVVPGRLYVMHKHAASHDHFDLRLEHEGVLRSWALPKGPSLDTGEKRLAVEVEDHPLEYGGFEGVIPADEYGGGTVMLWDAGSWRVNGKNEKDHIDFELDGEKLKGAWTLVRTRGTGRGRGSKGKSWLLIKRSERKKRKLEPDDLSVATGRDMQEIARDRDNAWIRGEARAWRKEEFPPPLAHEIARARPADFPSTLEPQLATLVEAAPTGDEWVHEIKLDGYRMLVHISNGEARFRTRNGHDWTARFPAQAELLAQLPVESAVLDGEVVASTSDGSTSFRKLQEALSRKDTGDLVFQAFDLVHLDGYDLRPATLLDRKQALKQLLDAADFGNHTAIRYSDHIVGKGPGFFEQCCALGLEGIIAKRADARYAGGRSRNWLKVKCTQHAEFVVGGFTPPSGSRSGFGSLLLGAYQDRQLVYAGRVGTGFSTRQLDELHAALKQREQDDPPFSTDVPDAARAHWVSPDIVIEVEFTERTRDGRLRHPSFRGVREDRDAREITLSGEIDMQQPATNAGSRPATRPGNAAIVAGVRLTHPERVMFPEQGVTKLDLARYYEDIADWILPLIARRPLTLVRCPEGRQAECFFQKHLAKSLAKNVPRVGFRESRGVKDYTYIDNLSHLIALVQSGVLEFHPFGSSIDDLEHPDMMVFDLDPSPGVPWQEMLRTTRELRARLESLGLPCFLRTTGGKGLHIVVPLEPRADWDEVKAFSQAVSERHAQDDPKRLTTNMSKAKRKGKIFIDYLRNARGSTAIASYSARAREGAPVAVPLRWDELGIALRPDRYRIDNVRRRLGALKADPWTDFFDAAVPLDKTLLKSMGVK